jgi:RNA polymerase sigma-70 factor (ECF subfamily)
MSDAVVTEDFAELANPYRRELVAHCYRMTGSIQDAEDLVQDTLLRAWRAYDSFDGKSSLRTWLYRIATNACLTSLTSSRRRELPSGLGAPTTDPENSPFARLESAPWIEPVPTSALTDRASDPASIAATRESTKLALIAAFQRLPTRQRAALILIDVAGFTPAEAAESLDMTVTAARSLVQRARATLDADRPIQQHVAASPSMDNAILQRYMHAFEHGDIPLLAGLLRSDVEYEMPPISTWLRGREAVLDLHVRRVFPVQHRIVATSANGFPAAASYFATADGGYAAEGIHVIEIEEGQIARATLFLKKDLFANFGLPLTLAASAGPRK